jgi:diguanylate cyclase (GGDEF)-like protein
MPVFALSLCGVVGTSLLLSIALFTAWLRFGRKRHALIWAAAFCLFTLENLLVVARVLRGGESFGLTLAAAYASLAGATLVGLGFRARAGLHRWQGVALIAAATAIGCTGLLVWRSAPPAHHPLLTGGIALMLWLAVDALRRESRENRAVGTMVMMAVFTLFFVFLTGLGLITVPFGRLPETDYQAAYLVCVPTSIMGVGLFALVLLAEDLALGLRELATIDPLTGALNRRGLEALAEREAARCKREGRPLSVVLADLDHFKAVNDDLGHAIGDTALRRFAAHLLDSVRTGDLVGRIGGEEFILVLPGAGSAAASELIARIRRTAPALIEGAAARAMPTASFGIAVLNTPGDSLAAAIARADAALYQAKADGRDCVRVARVP